MLHFARLAEHFCGEASERLPPTPNRSSNSCALATGDGILLGRPGGWPRGAFHVAHWSEDASVYYCSRPRGARRHPWTALQALLREAPATAVGAAV
eukprot:2180075-Amphidinium_carterae.1